MNEPQITPMSTTAGDTPFARVTKEINGGCPCCCHTGIGSASACVHCVELSCLREQVATAVKSLKDIETYAKRLADADGIKAAEKRPWRAIANKCRAALRTLESQ